LKHYTGKQKVQNLISDAIHGKIVPDLLRKNITTSTANAFSPVQRPFNEVRIEDFCEILATANEDAAFRQFELYLSEGVPVTDLLIDLVSNSARRLGELWGEDSCSFGDVTFGMAILHNIVRHYTSRLAHELKNDHFKGSIYIAPLPKQTHVFGSFMLEAFFVAAGWKVKSGLPASREEFLNEFSTHEYSAIALTISETREIEESKLLIRNIRNMSLNRDVKILVGGPVVIDDERICRQLGADASAPNALDALELVQTICNEHLRYG